MGLIPCGNTKVRPWRHYENDTYSLAGAGRPLSSNSPIR